MGHLTAQVEALLQDALNRQIGSGMAASFGKLQDLARFGSTHEIYLGRTSHPSPSHSVDENTFFDLASLSKVLGTTTLAMKLYDQGRLHLDESLQTLLPDAVRDNPLLGQIKVRDLLTHSSGVYAWKPFYEQMRAHFGDKLPYVDLATRKAKFDELLYAVPIENSPGVKVSYSDLGFLMLENLLSTDLKRDVESLWHSMGIPGLHYRPVTTDARSSHYWSERRGERIVATEICPWRGLLVGQVHDDNTWSKGGVAGHAGVFGRLKDVTEWIRAVFLGASLSKSTLQTFTQESVFISGTRRALGFDMPSPDGGGSTGFSFSKNTVGHLGFTGTSLWIDLDSGDYAILLTNRVHPTRDDNRIRGLRREFHRLVRGG